jgi:multidrug efflux system outer membrane protein
MNILTAYKSYKHCFWVLVFLAGCTSPKPTMPIIERPDVSPKRQTSTGEGSPLDGSKMRPMYQEIVAINLPTVVNVAMADNVDIRKAREHVLASEALLESAKGSLLPSLVPSAAFEDVHGSVRATQGNLVGVAFNSFQASIAVQWVLNPGKVRYEIIAAQKQLLAMEHQEQAVLLETLRQAASEYYALVLAQAQVAASELAVSEAEELRRINHLRTQTGMGIAADASRADAHLAKQQQVLSKALNTFYNDSISLAVTLHLDASVTLVPKATELLPIELVRYDIDLGELLDLAIRFRPDLEHVRVMTEVIHAKSKAAWWSGFGPALGVIYQAGGISSDDNTTDYAFKDNQQLSAGAAWNLTLSSFGAVKAAKAYEREALIDAEHYLSLVRAEVVRFTQSTKLYRDVMSKSKDQLVAAEEATHLIQAQFNTGTMTLLDVLQAQDSQAQARLDYTEAIVGFNKAQVNLLAAIGLIDKEKLVGTL